MRKGFNFPCLYMNFSIAKMYFIFLKTEAEKKDKIHHKINETKKYIQYYCLYYFLIYWIIRIYKRVIKECTNQLWLIYNIQDHQDLIIYYTTFAETELEIENNHNIEQQALNVKWSFSIRIFSVNVTKPQFFSYFLTEVS